MSAQDKHDEPAPHEHEHDEHGHDHAHPHAHDDAAELPPIGPLPEHGYWRSLKELAGTARLQQDGLSNREFPPGAGKDRPIDPLSRRNFFKLMGSSLALAGVTSACRRYEKEEIIPLARRPEDQIPGVTTQYATAFELGGHAIPLLATSYEGRPIHLEGNPDHPFHGGGIVGGTKSHAGLTTFAQASILHLYDPDRESSVQNNNAGSSLDAFRNALDGIRKGLTTARILSEATSSPTVARLKNALLTANPGLQWHEYEPITWDNEREGMRLAFGKPVRPVAKLDKCQTIVTIDCDIFVEHPAHLRYSRDFSKSRRMDGELGIGKMNRLWSVESQFSNTGAMADHRLAIRSELQLAFVRALDAALNSTQAPTASFLGDAKTRTFMKALVNDLNDTKGRAVVLAGRRASPQVHAVVAHINATLNAVGATLDYKVEPDQLRDHHVTSIARLANDIKGGRVQSLIILGGNPVYDAPADLNFGALLAGLPQSIHLAEYANETAAKAKWFIPRSHYLEAWGDSRTFDGTVTLAQPLIAPLYPSLSAIELLSALAGNEMSGEKLVKETNDSLTTNWRQAIANGFLTATLDAATVGQPNLPVDSEAQKPQSDFDKPVNGQLEVTFATSPYTYDGRFANNAWLHEVPDFLTKVTWDNYVLVGPQTAEACNVKNDTMVTVKVGNGSITLPCYTIPGQAQGSISVMIGGHRTKAGRVGGDDDNTPVGWETAAIRMTTGFEVARGGNLSSAGEDYELASVQDHWDARIGIMPSLNKNPIVSSTGGIAERVQDLIKETTADRMKLRDVAWFRDPEHQKLAPELKKDYRAEKDEEFFNDLANAGNADRPGEGGYSLFKEKDYATAPHRWAMAIDLTTCTGCNACTVACQSENNIPVVGRKEVMNNREMSWIRIDRYFSGSPDDPHVVHQPIGCQQCDQAPCEQVCPVGATSHSEEGLNDMAYNRCIGTRYCANNCPYKVRRFNFLDWNKEFREARDKVRRLLFNPEVTVRMRGVMEKCSFCVQRIQNAKIKQKAEKRTNWPPGAPAELADGAIVTACQAACPTEAIVFGDLTDKDSRVSKLHADRRSYALLPDLYTKPRNRFLAKVRNPHKDMPAASTGGHE